jgi:hypothetical protein
MESLGEAPSSWHAEVPSSQLPFDEDVVTIANALAAAPAQAATTDMWVPDAMAESCNQCE